MYAVVVGVYITSLIALYYLSKVYLVVAYVTDKYLIGSHLLADIDNISWFNYKEAMDNVIDFNLNLAKTPVHIVGDIYAKSNQLINKQHIKQRDSQSDIASNSNVIEMDILEEIKEENGPSTQLEYESEKIEEIVPDIDRYTVMFRDLPQQFQNQQALTSFMKQLFPNKIAYVIIVPDVSELNKIHQQIKKHKKALTKLLEKHDSFNISDLYNDDNLPQILEKTKCCGMCGEKVNAFKYHRDNKDALISRFIKLKQKGLSPTPTAFVIFNSLKEATNCISSPIRVGLKTLKISKAPNPKDLCWNNLRFKSADLVIYNVLVAVAMFFLLIFWSIPVSAIQVLANLDNIFEAFGGSASKTFGGEENVATLQGALTVLILDLWLGILPSITDALTSIQRKAYRGRHEMLSMTKYFDCLVFMVLLVTVVAGSALNGATDFADYVCLSSMFYNC